MKPDHPVASFSIGPTGKITTWNMACQRILGYSHDQVLLRQITSILARPTKDLFQNHMLAARSDAERLDAEIIHADGGSSTFNLTFVPQFRKSGKFSGFTVIIGPLLINSTQAAPESEREMIGRMPLKDMVNFLAGTFYVLNQAGDFVMWNKRVEQATQLTSTELKQVHVIELFGKEEQKKIADKISEVFEHDGEVLVQAGLLAKNGTTIPYLFTGARFRKNDQLYLCGMGLDMSERREQEERLRLRERALHASSNGIVIIRCSGKENPIEYVNPAFERITGYQEKEVIGVDSHFMSCFMAAPGLDETERAMLKMAINERREINVIFRNLRKNGELFWNDLTITPVLNDKGMATHFIGVINDITASKHRTSNLEHAINHDALTGLANRNLLWDRFEQALHLAQRNKTLVAAVLVDLDDFKAINDTMGHDAGDEVLKVAARRLQASVRDSDTVARLGGDEFVLVLSNQPSLRYTLRMIDRLRHDMAQPLLVDKNEIVIKSSMGVSVFPHDGLTVGELIQAADVAMYHAKAAGRNDVHFFSSDMKSTTEAKHKMENSMRHAIENDEMFIALQPKICLKTGNITGAEALLRWRHPDQGILLPASFLLEAEENGLIISIGDFVFDKICSILQRLKLLGFEHLVVSMNASLQQFRQKNYIATIAEKLSKSDLSPGIFELEIKEKNLLLHPQLATEIFADIRRTGIQMAIDDFGAGSSCLSELQKLAVNHLKISRSFMSSIGQKNMDGVMAKTIIDIGHNLNMAVIAEGVETKMQFSFLKEHGCDQMQGNYFSEPICLTAFEQLLNENGSMKPDQRA